LRGIRPHTYTNGNCYTDANSYSYRYAHDYTECDANSHSYAYSPADTHRQAEHNPEDTPHSASAPITLIYEKETHYSIHYL
jgi:hypothetical protein